MDEAQELLELLKSLTLADLQYIRGIPKATPRLHVFSIPLRKETKRLIKKLAGERGVRVGALGRELILIGLRHADELPEVEGD